MAQSILNTHTNESYIINDIILEGLKANLTFSEFDYSSCREVEVKYILVIVFVGLGIICVIALAIALCCARKYKRLYMALPEKDVGKGAANEYNLEVEQIPQKNDNQ